MPEEILEPTIEGTCRFCRRAGEYVFTLDNGDQFLICKKHDKEYRRKTDDVPQPTPFKTKKQKARVKQQ